MSLAKIDQHLARGDFIAAREQLDALLAREPHHNEALMRAIDVYAGLHEPAAALRCARELTALQPTNLDAQFYLAKAEFASGNLARAGELLAHLATTEANNFAALHMLRGNIFIAQNALPDAAHAFEIATTLAPNDVDAWTNLGYLQRASGAVIQAEASFERALALDANVAATWVALGQLLAETFKFPRAKQCFERALALVPNHEQALSTLGFVLAEMGETKAAADVLETKTPLNLTMAPPLPRRVRSLLLLPQVYNSIDDLHRWRNRFSDGLDQLLNSDNEHDGDTGAVWKIAQANFLLAYQGQNDRDFQVRYARFLRALIVNQQPDLLESPLRARARKRIRVVFVSSFFRECTVGQYFKSWITDLDPKNFERVVIHTGWQLDEFGRALEARCDQFIMARGGVLQVAETIRALTADIVIYPEVGMGVMNYLLTNMRLAPIQIAAWGHPVTTGSTQIDWFVTCGVMEPANASAHYCERLLMLPGIGTRYAIPAAINATITRQSFGLSNEAHLYICPQSLFKIHPDNDAIYLSIMTRDSRAVLLFFQSEHAAITQAFSQRLASQMAARGIVPREQIKFSPRIDAASFRAVLSFADVVLDTLHWSGGNTSLDALAVAAPIVTLPGEFMRGRQTAAMLGAMGVAELIVTDSEAYIAKAIEVACNANVRAEMTKKIAENRGAIFDRSESVQKLGEHLQNLFESQIQ